MNCKSTLLTITFAMLVLTTASRAQNQQPIGDSTIEAIRAEMQSDRTTVINAAMELNDKDAQAFWPIYRRYEYDRSKLDDRRVAVIKKYAEKYPALTDADAKTMAQEMFDCEARITAVKQKYFKEFSKVLPALTVAKFFQLDHRVDLVMDLKVEASFPPLAAAGREQQQE